MSGKASKTLEIRWRKILEDFVASDRAIRHYCQDRNVSKASLHRWSRRLNIPLRPARSSLTKSPQAEGNEGPSNVTRKDDPLSFLELKVSPFNGVSSFPVKLELVLAPGRLLKIEAASSWDGVVGMVKALVS